MPELDAVRGLAVLLVFGFHAFEGTGADDAGGLLGIMARAVGAGWLGVHLFFVLSGFLITGILLDTRAAPGYFRSFYVRRALRILPAYGALLVILALTTSVSMSFIGLSALFLANVSPLFGVDREYVPLWSLSVEEHFYLLWPLAIRRLSPRSLSILAAATILLGVVARYAAFGRQTRVGIYFFTWYTLDGLAVGALLALLMRSAWLSRRRLSMLASITGVIALVTLVSGRINGWLSLGPLATSRLDAALHYLPWCALFAAGLALALVAGSGEHASLVRSRALEAAGRISYGFYLYHMLLFWGYDVALRALLPDAARNPLVRLLVVGVLTTTMALLSRATLEEWFLRRKGRYAAGTSVPVTPPLPSAGGAQRAAA